MRQYCALSESFVYNFIITIFKNIIFFSLSLNLFFFLLSVVLDFYLPFNMDVIVKLPELLGDVFMYSTLNDATDGKWMAI